MSLQVQPTTPTQAVQPLVCSCATPPNTVSNLHLTPLEKAKAELAKNTKDYQKSLNRWEWEVIGGWVAGGFVFAAGLTLMIAMLVLRVYAVATLGVGIMWMGFIWGCHLTKKPYERIKQLKEAKEHYNIIHNEEFTKSQCQMHTKWTDYDELLRTYQAYQKKLEASTSTNQRT